MPRTTINGHVYYTPEEKRDVLEPVVTGNDIRDFMNEMHMDARHFFTYLGLGTSEAVYQLLAFGPEPIKGRHKVRIRFVELREKNMQPVPFWEPQRIVVPLSRVAGYLGWHVCGVGKDGVRRRSKKRKAGCGQGFWSTNKQRVFCMDCVPYEGAPPPKETSE